MGGRGPKGANGEDRRGRHDRKRTVGGQGGLKIWSRSGRDPEAGAWETAGGRRPGESSRRVWEGDAEDEVDRQVQDCG